MDKNEKLLLLFVPLSAILIEYFVFPNINNYKLAITYLVLSLLIGFGPIFFYKFLKLKRAEELNESLKDLFEDLSYNLSLGYSLKKSFENVSNNLYPNNKINDLLRKINNSYKEGFNSKEIIKLLVRSLNNPILRSYESLIIHVISKSQNLDILFKDISEEIARYLERQEDRKQFVYYSLLNTYISYVLFLFLLVILLKKIIPFNVGGKEELISMYFVYTTFLIFEEAILSGFLIGIMTLNEFLSGITHSLLLVGISYLVLMII